MDFEIERGVGDAVGNVAVMLMFARTIASGVGDGVGVAVAKTGTIMLLPTEMAAANAKDENRNAAMTAIIGIERLPTQTTLK